MRRLAPFAALLFSILLPACNNGNVAPADPSSVPDPSKPVLPSTPPNETFSSRIAELSGTNFHLFTTAKSGTVYVALTVVTPNVPLAVGLGVPNGDGCSLGSLQLASAAANAVATEQINEPAGNLCVAVEDQERLAPFNYTIQVWHQ